MESFLGIDGRYLPNGFFKDDFKEVEKPELYDHDVNIDLPMETGLEIL